MQPRKDAPRSLRSSVLDLQIMFTPGMCPPCKTQMICCQLSAVKDTDDLLQTRRSCLHCLA